MSQKNNENPLSIFYACANGSNDGSVYSNKTFHVVYHVIKHDFANKMKTVIGILYNKADGENNKLYFNCIMPLTEQFSIPYLLKNIIYKPRYDKYQMRKVLTEEGSQTRPILQYADKILMLNVNEK